MKKKLLVSFSGGETSAYMLWWILNNWGDEYEIKVVFTNTGQENEETLIFIKKCSEYFNVEIIWVEAVVNPENRKGTTHKIVDFYSADRSGIVFESVIAKYGIPNRTTPHCNRELKLKPLHSYMRSLGWKKYYSAIGIRIDEIDRINSKKTELKLLYPLISNKPMTKPQVNFWWSQQPFRLELKGYQGNCKWCWKKSDAKLFQLLKENESIFDFPKQMETKYGEFIPETRLSLMKGRGDDINLKTRFFRQNRSVEDLIKESVFFTKNVVDDAAVIDTEFDLFELMDDSESCDIYSSCGD